MAAKPAKSERAQIEAAFFAPQIPFLNSRAG